MGIKKDFFSKPIPIPVTFHENVVGEDNTVTQSKVNLLFKLRRETGNDASLYAMSALLEMANSQEAKKDVDALSVEERKVLQKKIEANNQTVAELKLARFCNLLVEPPIGFDDFPDDESVSLKERAREYFAGEEYEELINVIMIFYNQNLFPFEAFR